MTDEEEFIQSHINYIRRMALLNDDNIRMLLKLKIADDPSIIEKFKDNKMKKQYDDIRSIAKNISKDNLSLNKLGRQVA